MRPQNSALTPTSAIPDKLYFKIGEVSRLVGVQAHVLRYWEKEVPGVRPVKSTSNQRRYRYKDVEIFREIRRLLYEERYTLAGARKRLATGDRGGEATTAAASDEGAPDDSQLPLGFRPASTDERIEHTKQGLRELIRMAGEEPGADV